VGSLAAPGDPVRLTPEHARWQWTGLDVLRLEPGERRAVEMTGRELLVLPLSGGCSVLADGRRLVLAGRDDVFAAQTDFVYAGPGAVLTVESPAGAELALPWARATSPRPVQRFDAGAAAIEVRGAGAATRRIINLFTAGTGEADRLAVVEVLTPAGHWSSWPPHKHDDASAGIEDELEEIYYFRIGGGAAGFGFHRTYTADGALDETVTVRDGDVFLVPRGFHGPCAAAPGHPMYYLNVLAGPRGARTLRFSDDPAHAGVRAGWAAAR
jgi:5-deoxy-glucuronate isomerase